MAAELLQIPPYQFVMSPFAVIGKQQLLLTAGENVPGRFNTMTIAWGMLGILWSKPVVQVYVRPGRYTYKFLEEYPTFTLCAFPAGFERALAYCGAHSGRDIDKVKESGLIVRPSRMVPAPGFAGAELIIECRKLYSADLLETNFIDAEIHSHYPQRDYHRSYIGEVVAVSGTEAYLRP